LITRELNKLEFFSNVNNLQYNKQDIECKQFTYLSMKPSKYQEKILEWLQSGNGNATCNAVAGSGKTTTLKLAAQQLQSMRLTPSDIKVIVFGKQNSLDLITKFGREWKYSIQTLHSVGFRVLQHEIGRFRSNEKIVSSKYRQIAEQKKLIPKKTKQRSYKGSLTESNAISRVEHFLTLIDLARLTLSDLSVESIESIAYHHNLEGIHDFKRVSIAIANILVEGQEQAINDHRIDFTDMVWLPVEWGLNERKWFQTYKFVLVDECQDLNAAQLELSLMLAGDKGRMLYVGDPRQAIFGFAGADNRSYQNIVERTKATELPLSLCYRCPKSHIELVNQLYSEIPIEYTPEAAPGILECIENSDLWNDEHPGRLVIGDMVLSRKTAPLVSLCIRLIGRGIAATVKGKDIGKQIKSELEAIADITGFRYEEFNLFVEEYRRFKFQTYENLDNAEQLKENLADKLNALSTIYSSQPNATCVAHLCTYIDDLFSDDESPITLSTCHRAKGLEGDRIFIIKPEDMPMVWERQLGWQKEQEDNLLYVALTRSKSTLYIVGQPDWFKDNNERDENEDTARTSRASGETPDDVSSTSETPTETSNENTSNGLDELATSMETSTSSSTVNGLQLKSNIDADYVMTLISELDFEEKCKLFALFNDELTQEKWAVVTSALKDDANRSDRAIASASHTSTPFVSKVRKNLILSNEIEVEISRVDKRGRKHKSPIAKEENSYGSKQ
jgi:DNA helicase II / ATP-dependent DNA helicase PcrA